MWKKIPQKMKFLKNLQERVLGRGRAKWPRGGRPPQRRAVLHYGPNQTPDPTKHQTQPNTRPNQKPDPTKNQTQPKPNHKLIPETYQPKPYQPNPCRPIYHTIQNHTEQNKNFENQTNQPNHPKPKTSRFGWFGRNLIWGIILLQTLNPHSNFKV
jgi:hypothetical protein